MQHNKLKTLMFKRQASIIDAQQATSLTYSVIQYANILKVFTQYQHMPCHHMKSKQIFNNQTWARQAGVACWSCCYQESKHHDIFL